MANKDEVPLFDFKQWSKHPVGKTYLLFIAIDNYKNGVRPLANAVSDAKAVAECLLEQFELDENYCKTLYNEEATTTAITEAFDEYLKLLSDQDNLLFYFSGHGYYHEPTQRGYWLPANAVSGRRDTFFSNNEVLDFIRGLNSRHVFGIVDSCFSEALFTERNTNAMASRRYNIPSRWLLTAGRLEPVSDGALGDHSPFAKALLTELRYNEHPALWVSELCKEVLTGVINNSEKQLPRGQPLQNLGDQGGEFVLVRRGHALPPFSPKSDNVLVTPQSELPNATGHKPDKRKTEPTLLSNLEEQDVDTVKNILEELLSQDEWITVFDHLKRILGRERKRKILLQLIARYHVSQKNDYFENHSAEQIEVNSNKIRYNLLTFINNLKERDLKLD